MRAAAGAQVVDVDTVGCGIAAPTYAPAPMGTGLGWTDEERVALCKAYLSTSLDPVKGADQSGPTFWTSVVTAWKGLLAGRPGVRRRTERGVGGVQKQWDKIRRGVSEFGSHYLAVKRLSLKGNPSDEDLISAAVARFCGLNIYEAMRKDRASDKAKGKTTKRKAKQTTCPWVPCWRVLRHVDKFSGAAGAAAADGGAGGAGSSSASAGGRASPSDTDEEENGPPAAGAFQSRPRGSKAAKREMSEGIRASRTLKDSSDALLALARATTERTTVAFFNTSEMRDTPEAISFRKMHARKLMAAAGMDLSSSPPAMSSGPAGTAAPLATDAGSSTAPAAVSEVHPPPPVGNKPAAVGSEAQSPPASGDNTPAASATTAPVPKKTGRGTSSRGARSQVTKQAKAAEALSAASTTLEDDDEVYLVPMHHNKVADDADCAVEESSGDDDHSESL